MRHSRRPRSGLSRPVSQITVTSEGSVTTGSSQTIAFSVFGPLYRFRVTSFIIDFSCALPVSTQVALRGDSGNSDQASAVSQPISTGYSHRRITLRQPKKTDWSSDSGESVHFAWLYLRLPGTLSESAPFVYSVTFRYSMLPSPSPSSLFSERLLVSPREESLQLQGTRSVESHDSPIKCGLVRPPVKGHPQSSAALKEVSQETPTDSPVSPS